MSHAAIHTIASLPEPGTLQAIGEILVEQGKLTAENRDQVLNLQQQTGRRFGELAVSLDLVQQCDIEQVLAQQFSSLYLGAGVEQYPAELIAAHQPFSPQIETFRAVRSKLVLHRMQQGGKGLAVVSYNEGDAASYFTANLAVVFSQLQERTLLVDANLRRSRQHHIFNLCGRPGLSDILAGRAGIEAITRVKHFPNLSILPAGTPPPNPQELLCRPAFTELNAELTQRFDAILYDVSTFSECADALIVAAHTRHVMLLAARNKTRITDIVRINEQLSLTGAKMVGSVLLGE